MPALGSHAHRGSQRQRTGRLVAAALSALKAARALGAVVALAALVAAGCLSPSLPLPPPTITSIGSADALSTSWSVTGDCVPGAIVTVFNESTGQGGVVEDRDQTGRFSITIEASLCDLGWAKQEDDSDLSSRATFVVEPQGAFGPLDPAACQSAN